MSLINKEVNDFEVKAFQNDEFKTAIPASITSIL